MNLLIILIILVLCAFLYVKLKDINSKLQSPQTTTKEFRSVLDELLDDRCVILDTETTGLTDSSEIIEISLIDSNGSVLLNTLVKPKRKMRADNKAVAIHGITNEMLENAPQWNEIHDRFCSLINGKRVVIYNAKYDLRLLEQTSSKYGLSIPDFRPECAMLIYGAWEGTKNEYGTGVKYHKLEDAAQSLGVVVNGKPHRALTDCLKTLSVLKKIRDIPPKKK